MLHNSEQFLGTVNVLELHEYHWPIIRVLASRFVDRLELRRHERHLLDSGQWKSIRSVPQRRGCGAPSGNVYELYGTPAEDHLGSAAVQRASEDRSWDAEPG